MGKSAKKKGPDLKVLLVDDEVGFLRVVGKRMGRRNIEVTEAKTGSEAVAILRKTDFDAAIVDLKMDDIDGIEVLRIFKKMVPDLPVIILTGHGSEKAARQGISNGAYDYLTKPCEFEDLLSKIREAVRESRAREP